MVRVVLISLHLHALSVVDQVDTGRAKACQQVVPRNALTFLGPVCEFKFLLLEAVKAHNKHVVLCLIDAVHAVATFENVEHTSLALDRRVKPIEVLTRALPSGDFSRIWRRQILIVLQLHIPLK
jgi:hypothetical protein